MNHSLLRAMRLVAMVGLVGTAACVELGTTSMPSDFPVDRGEYQLEGTDTSVDNGREARLGPYLVTMQFQRRDFGESDLWKLEVVHQATGNASLFECENHEPSDRDRRKKESAGTMSCTGEDNQGAQWGVEVEAFFHDHVYDGLSALYEGKVTGPTEYVISGFGEESRGGAPGYRVSHDDTIQFAVRPPNFRGGAEVWIASVDQQPIGAVGAALSLLIFQPENQ